MARSQEIIEAFTLSDGDSIGNFTELAGDFDISSNQVVVSTAAADAIHDTALSSTRQYVSIEVTGGFTTAGTRPTLYIRSDSSANNAYCVQFRGDNNDIVLYRKISGNFGTAVATINPNNITDYANNDVIEAQVQDNNDSDPVLTIYVNGVEEARWTDTDASAITTGNYVGFRASTTNPTFDNFKAGIVYDLSRSSEFTDDFNRADNDSLGASWNEQTGDADIVSNELKTTSSCDIMATQAMSDTDQYAQATWVAQGDSNSRPGLMARCTSNYSDGYQAQFRNAASDVVFYRKVSGSNGNISTGGSYNYVGGEVISFEVETNSHGNVDLRAYVDGVLIHSYTDSSASKILTGDYVGIRDSVANTTFDDFSAGVLVSASSVSVTPSASSVSLTAEAPTLTVNSSIQVTPSPSSVSLTADSPTLSVNGAIITTPSASSVSVTADSPTLSVSKTITPSPSSVSITAEAPSITTGSEYYYGELTSLPTGLSTTGLTNLSSALIADLETTDGTYVSRSMSGTNYGYFLFNKLNSSGQQNFTLTTTVKTNVPPSSSTVYFQVYNQNSTTWETLDSDNTTAINTNIILSGTKDTNVANYYDANDKVWCRVYQQNA